MILYGSNVSDGIMSDSQTCLTLCQIISFNAKKKATHSFIAQPVDNRHCRDREPPLPIYIGLSINTATRSKKLVNQLAQLGLSIKYDRVMELETTMAVSSCAHFMSIGVVCPPNLRRGLFTVGALDNIDHNPSSTTSQGAFHGTAISVTQHTTSDNKGILQECSPDTDPHHSQLMRLPDSYAIVPAVFM